MNKDYFTLLDWAIDDLKQYLWLKFKATPAQKKAYEEFEKNQKIEVARELYMFAESSVDAHIDYNNYDDMRNLAAMFDRDDAVKKTFNELCDINNHANDGIMNFSSVHEHAKQALFHEDEEEEDIEDLENELMEEDF